MYGTNNLTSPIFMEIHHHAVIHSITSYSSLKCTYNPLSLWIDLHKFADQGKHNLVKIWLVFKDVNFVFENTEFLNWHLYIINAVTSPDIFMMKGLVV